MPAIIRNKGQRCSEIGCTNGAFAGGLCHKHYAQKRRDGARDESATHDGKQRKQESVLSSLKALAIDQLSRPLNARIADWALEKIVLPVGEGVGGEARLSWECYSHVPWVFDAVQNPKTEEFVLCCASQFGKSIILYSLAGYWAGEKSWNGLYVLPTEKLVKRVPKNRLGKTLERSNIGYKGIQNNDLHFHGGNYIRIGLMSSPDSMAEMPGKFVIMDELDENVKWTIDPVKLSQNRLTTAHRKITVLASTPKIMDEHGIAERYKNSKRHHLEMKCPFCSAWFHSRFDEHFRWPDGLTPEKIKEERLGWVECPECKGIIDDSYHADIVKHGQRVVCIDPDKSLLTVGLLGRKWETIWTKYSDVVAEYLRCENDESKLRDFYNSWCAEPKEIEPKSQFVNLVRNKGGYLRGEHENDSCEHQIPEWVQAVTVGTDSDDSAIWYCLYGWGHKNRVAPFYTSRIKIEGKGQAALEDALAQMPQAIDLNRFKFLGEGKFERPKLIHGCMDAGYQTTVIYDYCRHNPLFVPVKGGSPSRLYEMRQADPKDEHRGKYRGLHFYLHDTHQLQEILHNRFLTDPNKPGGIEFAADEGKRLFAHIQAVKRVEIMKRGRLVIEWLKKSNKSQDHLRDAMANAELAGRMCGLEEIPEPKTLDAIKKIAPKVKQSETVFSEWYESGR